jgi:hypothetical protein
LFHFIRRLPNLLGCRHEAERENINFNERKDIPDKTSIFFPDAFPSPAILDSATIPGRVLAFPRPYCALPFNSKKEEEEIIKKRSK